MSVSCMNVKVESHHDVWADVCQRFEKSKNHPNVGDLTFPRVIYWNHTSNGREVGEGGGREGGMEGGRERQ